MRDPPASRSSGRPWSAAKMCYCTAHPEERTGLVSDIPRSRRPAPIAQRLRAPLERLYADFDYAGRVERDAIRFPLRYADPRDREVVALLTACLAYGRVDLFGGALEKVLAVMGPSPARFMMAFEPERHGRLFSDFLYRFNRPRDIVAFCVAARQILERHGGLEACFLAGDPDPTGPMGPAIEAFARAFLGAELGRRVPAGPTLPRVPPPVPLALGGWPLQAPASVPALDGAA